MVLRVPTDRVLIGTVFMTRLLACRVFMGVALTNKRLTGWVLSGRRLLLNGVLAGRKLMCLVQARCS